MKLTHAINVTSLQKMLKHEQYKTENPKSSKRRCFDAINIHIREMF